MEHYTHLDMKERFLINHYLSIKTNVQTIASVFFDQITNAILEHVKTYMGFSAYLAQSGNG